jgi:membrane associated rhomboid family serine protease
MPLTFLRAPITFLLISAIAFTTVVSFYNKKFKHQMLLHPYAVIKQRQYYRLFSAEFVHINWMHLIFNILIIYSVGVQMEKELTIKSTYGELQFMGLFIFCSFGGNVLSSFLNRKDFSFTSCGASPGAIGLFISLLMLNPNDNLLKLPFIKVQNFQLVIYFVIIFIINFVTKRLKQIDNAAHLGGVLAAILFSYLFILPPA